MDGGETVRQTEEPSTLPWPGDRQTGGQTGGQTGKGDRMSWTESERQLLGDRKGAGPEEKWAEPADKWAGPEEKWAGPEEKWAEPEEKWAEPEEKWAGPEENQLPEKAAQVFSPAPSSPRDTEAFWEMESEKSPFLSPRGTQDYNQHGRHWAEATPPDRCGRCCLSRDVMKLGVSLMTSALLFPFLVWGGFVFLPFDAPLLHGVAARLVYTLRCSVFAATPIVLGWLVLGVSRLRSGATRPLCGEQQLKGAELRDVTVHRRFVSDSASLFLIYFLQLVVMAMYLSQEHLKLVPLLTVVFALGRLVYWAAAAFGSSVRGFGFGLSFLPSLVMTVANIYFIFTVEASGSIFSQSSDALTPPAGRQRFWG